MPFNKLTPTKPNKDQPWRVWVFVFGFNLVHKVEKMLQKRWKEKPNRGMLAVRADLKEKGAP